MADLSAIKLPNGTTYNLRDRGALPLTGGAVTGPVSFGDSVSIDDATIGSLVVNGSASFTNNIQANTINGVAVGSNPKFTDTTYSSLAAASGGTAVSLVTTGEKYTWNSKTSNTGTVTKVTAGTGLSIGTTAGGNFTTTGTINHTNSVTAQTTQAVYPIKIDAQGHISAYGSAVTIPTVPSNIVNTITTTAGAHTAITSQKGNVSFNVPTTAAHVGAATSNHAHGNITNGGDITATAPTIASGDQIIINDNSASKVTNGPTFDGSTTTTALTPKGTWENFSKFSGSYNDLTNKPTIPSAASLLDIFYPVGTIYETTVAPEIFNPNTAWGGEWEPIHGRFLVAEGNNEATGDEALNLSAGGTGGKNAYKLSAAESGMRAHTHTTGTHYHTLSSHTHAGPSHHHSGPSHSHGVPESTSGTSENFLSIDSGVSNASFTISTSGNHRYTVGFSGSGHFHSHAATKSAGTGNTGDAGTGATGAPSKDYTSTAYNTTSGTGTPNTGGVNTISNGIATSAHENLPPYLAVYMWKRIA